MKKISFDDRFLLTQKVLCGEKTQTRRLLKINSQNQALLLKHREFCQDPAYLRMHGQYQIGDIVAISQSYKTVTTEIDDTDKEADFRKKVYNEYKVLSTASLTGWNNKLFVKASLMPHNIVITDKRIELLQDITDNDAKAEGIEFNGRYAWVPINQKIIGWQKLNEKVLDHDYDEQKRKVTIFYTSPKKAYAAMINEICGKNIWQQNLFVIVYTFKLVK